MMEPKRLQVVAEGLHVMTRGLLESGHPELRARVADLALLQEAEAFLRFVGAYVLQNGLIIRSGETVRYGYWVTRFEATTDELLDAFEFAGDSAEGWVPGVNNAVTYWRDQHTMCSRLGAEFAAPLAYDFVMISPGVMEGDPVQGVRYPSAQPESGWWISTDRYNGDVSTMAPHHLYHLTGRRPDLAPFLALPFGYRFDLEKFEDVWFDESVASEPIDPGEEV
jgi:hypothetical protein